MAEVDEIALKCKTIDWINHLYPLYTLISLALNERYLTYHIKKEQLKKKHLYAEGDRPSFLL